jgi:hypothetical protein
MRYWILVLILTGFVRVAGAQNLLVYSEAADQLHLSDQISLWHTSFRTTFRDHWQTRFGFSQVDKRWFDGFAAIRRKYHPQMITQASGGQNQQAPSLFSAAEIEGDVVADAFFTSATIDQALAKLRDSISREEHQYLSDFFSQYRARFQEIIGESEAFRRGLPRLQSGMTSFRLDLHLRRVETYLGVEPHPQLGPEAYRSYLVWWPPQARSEVAQVGSYILLRTHPLSHYENMGPEVVIEAAVRGVFRRLSTERRASLERDFRLACRPPEGILDAQVIELPLTLALSRLYFEEETKRRQFFITKEWSGHPWVSLMAKLIYPEVRRAMTANEPLDTEGLSRMSSMCRELNAFKAL